MGIQQVKVIGIVLTAMPISEYDKRLVILTKERGKISVFAKGARKQNSPLLACSQPFSFGEFILYEGKTSYNIVSVSIDNYFVELRKELNLVYYGMYFCEFTEYMTRENMQAKDILKLLYQSLKALEKRTIPIKLIRVIYEWKMFALNGEMPQVFECVKCGNTEDNKLFSVKAGGLICGKCKELDAITVCGSTIYTLQYIATSSIEKLYTFNVSSEVLAELTMAMKRYEALYIDKQFKTLEFLDLL